MDFYELHEGDEEIYSDVILARDEPMEPEEFFDIVQGIRLRIQDAYEEETLIEAIALELQRDHGFIYISDERIVAAVNVSVEEDENFLIVAEDEDLEADLEASDYRGVFVDYTDTDEGGRPN